MALQGRRRKKLAEATESSSDNNVNRNSASPWPDVETEAVTFLLDVRDDFEARLLREWVEAEKPASAQSRHNFIKLPKRRGGGHLLDDLLLHLDGLDDLLLDDDLGGAAGEQHRQTEDREVDRRAGQQGGDEVGLAVVADQVDVATVGVAPGQDVRVDERPAAHVRVAAGGREENMAVGQVKRSNVVVLAVGQLS